jgi:murein L,D-transpeptidase YcbB/YkuD
MLGRLALFLPVITLSVYFTVLRTAAQEAGVAQPAPSPEAVQAAPSPEAAQAAPSPEAAQAAPSPEAAQAAPSPEAAQATPSPEAAQATPSPEAAQATPSPEAAQAAPSPEAAQATPSPEAAQATPSPEAAQATPSPEAAQATPSPEAAQATPLRAEPSTAVAVAPAAASPDADQQPNDAASALDAAPSDESNPDPLAPPEDAEPAPAAPGARALPEIEAPVQETATPIIAEIRTLLAGRPAPSRRADKEDLAGMKAFYEAKTGQPIWTSAEGFNERALKTIAEIRKAGEWGLDERAFELPKAPAGQAAPEALADAEVKLSIAVLKYARYARGGWINPRALSGVLDRKPRIYDPKTVLQAVASEEAPDAYLRGLHPKHEQFRLLRKALLAGSKPVRPGADVRLPMRRGRAIRPGRRDPDVALVRQRLNVSEKGANGEADVYDDALVDAVKAFQKEHGLKPTGLINRRLRSALNEEAADAPGDKRMSILANMEKWRWMPDDLGGFYVWNSIPEQITRVFDKGRQVLKEKIVVGKRSTPTPVFSAKMRFVIFHPEWNVPNGIKTKELWPRLRRVSGGGFFGGNGSAVLRAYGLRAFLNGREVDPDMIDWSHTDIRRYQFTQPPGRKNVLGIVKFRFPNKHDVYMHDTPQRHLFASRKRAFSHGCMRVQNPVRLAEVVLAHDKGWSAARVRELAAERAFKPDEIALTEQIPVHTTYFTLTVDKNGALQKHPDIYGLDRDIIRALKGKPMDVTAASTVVAGKHVSPKSSTKRASGRRPRQSHPRPARTDDEFFFWD